MNRIARFALPCGLCGLISIAPALEVGVRFVPYFLALGVLAGWVFERALNGIRPAVLALGIIGGALGTAIGYGFGEPFFGLTVGLLLGFIFGRWVVRGRWWSAAT